MTQIEFDQAMVERLERMYATRDVLRRRELVHVALGAQEGERVLDLGCGPGFYVAELLDAVGPNGSVVGVDRSADMLAVATRRVEGRPNVEFIEAAATALPIADESFDRALSVQVFEYVEDVPAALAEVRRTLRPRGRLVLWDVDWGTVSWHARDVDLMVRVLAAWDKHLAHPSLPRTLSGQLRAAGFQEVRVEAHPFATNALTPETYGGSLISLLPGYVTGQAGIGRDDAKRWQDEQLELDADGDAFFSVTQFCFSATRSP